MGSHLPGPLSQVAVQASSARESEAWQEPLSEQPPASAPQLQRYLAALRRNRWLILAVTVLGAAAGGFGARYARPIYEAQTVFMIEVSTSQSFSQGPIRAGELLQSSAWIDLLRSFLVLDHVVQEQRLFIHTADENRPVFGNFALGSQFQPGEYTLKLDRGAGTFVLSSNGVEVDKGPLGAPIGSQLGFDWTIPRDSLPPAEAIDFTIVNPRDEAVRLSMEIVPSLAPEGNFMRISLADTDPVRATATLNSLANRYVTVAAELKRDKYDQLTAVLEEQRQATETKLTEAEAQLETFRVSTATLPTDRGAPVNAGLEITRDPVMDRFFAMKIDADQLRNDREMLERILIEAQTAPAALDGLSMIGPVQYAPALKEALDTRLLKRAELRALQERYTDEYPAVVAVKDAISRLEQFEIPRLGNEYRAQMQARENDMQSQIGSASAELRQIPPRAIEEARLERQVATAENLQLMVKQRFEEARLAAASTIPDVRVLDTAVVPTTPSRDPRRLILALGLLGSLGISIAGVLLLDRFDPRLRYPDEVTYGMGLSILGVVPKVKQLAGTAGKEVAAHAAEAFREIRLNLLHAHGAAGPVMVTITSPGSGDGKSFLSANLGLAFADQGYRTLIIDGDTRRGTLHRSLGVDRVPGLTDFLAGSASIHEVVQESKYPNVYLIGAGTRMSNGPELLSSKRMTDLLYQLKPQFGVILVDTPPLGAGVDAFALATLTRNLLLVLRTGTTDRAMAIAKLGMLDRLPVRLLGAILNGTPSDAHAYRYYSYLPGYQLASEELEVPQLTGAS
jgi:polysaccharide biosynthesis transport protein